MNQVKFFKKSILSLLLFVFIFNIVGSPVKAKAFTEFSVRAILPQNQVDKKVSYFDLQLKPGQKQTIKLLVTNASKTQSMKPNIEFFTASTSRTGLIVYNGPNRKDESLKYSLSDLVKIKNSHPTIAPSSSSYIEAEIVMPNEQFQGVLLGGFVVTTETTKQSNNHSSQNGIALENRFAFTIGLKVRQNTTPVEPDFHLKYIKPELINYRTAVVANLQNSEPLITKNMKIQAWVFKKDSQTVLNQAQMLNAEMAPNSNFDFAIDWQGKKLKPGEYRLKMRVEYNQKIWEFEEPFTISDVNAINDKALISSKIPTWVFYVIGFVLLLLFAFLFFLLGKKKSKKEKSN